ncbi:hypothetical protein [Streptomyces lydicus]|uniref:hypothetical protein n=1 Tax=Streptomyces lydicus TaxID=47763 RepID=UPI002E32B9B0|nr:hypothetical protein [Streptomyces lydicus]
MLQVPAGHGRNERAKFHPPKARTAEPNAPPANTLGMCRVMSAVDDLEDAIARLHSHGGRTRRRAGALREQLSALLRPRPEGIIAALAEQLG